LDIEKIKETLLSEEKMPCPQCGRLAKRKKWWILKSSKGGGYPLIKHFTCETCGATFRTRIKLTKEQAEQLEALRK
jgi:DNA-directed RNA polymerase subunit M/transcription elongation factor TFIIS